MSDPSREPGWERATLEKLAFSALQEQRSARRWKIFFRLAWLVLIAAVAFTAAVAGARRASISAVPGRLCARFSDEFVTPMAEKSK